MKKNTYFLLFFFLTLCFLETVKGQDPPSDLGEWYILMKNKNQFIGRVLERGRKTVLVSTETIDSIRLKMHEIKYAELYHPEMMIDSVYWPKSRVPNHNTFTPTGKIDRSFYQNIFFIFQMINVKVKDNISIAMGLTPILDTDLNSETTGDYIYWLGPKFSIPVKAKQVDVSVGYWGGISLIENKENPLAGVAYGVGTYSNEFYSASFGLGTGMRGGKILRSPVYIANVKVRAQKRSFVNLEIFGGGGFGTFANLSLRRQSKRGTWDLGWIFLTNQEIPIDGIWGGPYISAITPFGRTRL